jgi:Fibronectin type III-like domain
MRWSPTADRPAKETTGTLNPRCVVKMRTSLCEAYSTLPPERICQKSITCTLTGYSTTDSNQRSRIPLAGFDESGGRKGCRGCSVWRLQSRRQTAHHRSAECRPVTELLPSETLRQARYLGSSTQPLFPFGWGLRYTTFKYSDLRLSAATIGTAGQTTVSVEVTNSGKVRGDEVVQLYIRDEVSSVTRPIKKLRDFRRITLEQGEKKPWSSR